MARYNRNCNFCGNPYYVCRSCIDINSWKNVCCSPECFQKLFEPKTEEKIKETSKKKKNDVVKEDATEGINFKPIEDIEGEVDMFGVLVDTKKRIKINGFDLELGKFDCEDDTTKMPEDFEEFAVTYEELQEIAKINKTEAV